MNFTQKSLHQVEVEVGSKLYIDQDLGFNVSRSMFVSMTDQSVSLKKNLSASLKHAADAFTVSHKTRGSGSTFAVGTLLCFIEIYKCNLSA